MFESRKKGDFQKSVVDNSKKIVKMNVILDSRKKVVNQKSVCGEAVCKRKVSFKRAWLSKAQYMEIFKRAQL